MKLDVLALALPFFFAVFVWDAWKHGHEDYVLKDTLCNMANGAFNQLGKLLALGWILALYGGVEAWSPYRIQGLVAWVGSFFLIDLLYYFYHRASHRIGILWAIHEVHHSSEKYNFSVSMRQPFLEWFYHYLFYLPLAALGVPLEIFLVNKGVHSAYQLFLHTRRIDKFWPWIELIFNTPSHHRVHHGRDPQYLDKNYGATLILWDRLFRTFEVETVEPSYGVTHRVEGFNPLWVQLHGWVRLLRKFLPSYQRMVPLG